MIDELRRASAHVFVEALDAPDLTPDDEHHLARVLRLRDGEIVTAGDGRGGWRTCRWSHGRLDVDGDERRRDRDHPIATLAIAIPKQSRPEWIVQKATEIGIDRIVWLHADRSVVRWSNDRAVGHLERLRRVAREASAQSRRLWLPDVDGPVPSADVLPQAAVAEPGGADRLDEQCIVAIGPEGGWSPGELEFAASLIDLGPHVLRTETAALVAATQLCLGAR